MFIGDGSFKRIWRFFLGLVAGIASSACLAQSPAVTLAGVAYSGDAASIQQRFRYSSQYAAQLPAGDSMLKRTQAALAQHPSTSLDVRAEPIEELKGRDQAIVTSLVLNSETVSVEEFGGVHKLFVLIRGQALFFDFKSMAVVRSYPISFAYIDNLRTRPTESDVQARVKLVFEGANGKPGLFGRYAQTLASAQLPQQTPRFVQVTQVEVAPEMLQQLPAYLKTSESVYQTWAADLVAEAISTRVGIPMVPFSKGYAIGNVMSMQVLDGDVFNLTLPKPDYEIGINLKGLKKVQYSQNNAGTSYVYGAFADVRMDEPLSGKSYLNTSLKNAEVKVVPATQTVVDDFPAFYDALNGMFVKLAESVAGRDEKWIKSAAGAADIAAQMTKTKELMNLCK